MTPTTQNSRHRLGAQFAVQGADHRRECLDWLIPLSESHLRSILSEWMIHYNGVSCYAHPHPDFQGRAVNVSGCGRRLPTRHA
jgi:hypothetical protein